MRFLQRSWDILSQHLSKPSLPLIFLLTTPHLQAIHDTNQNGVSDLWEKKYNSGALYLTFTPTADPDADGWTNAQEAAAGTDPTTGVGPIGHVRTEITHTPAVYLSPEEEGGPPELDTPEVMTITWPTVAGKKYTLLFSTDLTAGNWTPIGTPRLGAGTEIGTSIPLTQPDGSTPAALFWRVTIADEDWDADTLTNAEEAELGSNPNSADGDGDGLSDVDELFVYHTNPSSSDTDNDGVSDGEEIASGHNPQSNQSYSPRWNIALRTANIFSPCKARLRTNWPPYFSQLIESSDRIPVSTLPSLVASMPFPDQAPDNLLLPHSSSANWEGVEPFYGLVQDAIMGSLTEGRYWLQTKPASNVEIKRTFLKLTCGYRMTYSPVTEVFPPIVEKLEVTIPANSTASLPIDIMPPLNFPSGFYTSIGNRVLLLPIDIEPDANMAKVVGDVVKSAKAGSTVEHFVTPKKSIELNQDYVELKAVGVDTATFSKLLEWEGGEAGSTPDKRKVKRDTAGKTEVKIKVKEGGAVAAQMNVWVTWADLTLEDNTPKIQSAVDSGSVYTQKAKISYRYVCSPNIMFDTTQDVPNLNVAPSPQAPGGNHPWPLHEQLANGASVCYDATRQVRAMLNSSDPEVLAPERAAGFNDIPNFPQDIAVGNDDPNMALELVPYQGDFGTQGVMRDIDSPLYALKHSIGLPDSTFSLHAQFRQYARVQIAGKWYCCSDLKLSDLKLKFKKTNGKWSDDGSTFVIGNGPFQTPAP